MGDHLGLLHLTDIQQTWRDIPHSEHPTSRLSNKGRQLLLREDAKDQGHRTLQHNSHRTPLYSEQILTKRQSWNNQWGCSLQRRKRTNEVLGRRICCSHKDKKSLGCDLKRCVTQLRWADLISRLAAAPPASSMVTGPWWALVSAAEWQPMTREQAENHHPAMLRAEWRSSVCVHRQCWQSYFWNVDYQFPLCKIKRYFS